VSPQNWPTANARDWKDSGPTQGNRQNPNLGTAVVKDAANWPTPSGMDGQRPVETQEQWEKRNERKKRENPNLGQLHRPLTVAVTQHGQAAPASGSSLGSRQELSEPSQRNWQTFAPGTNNRGMTPHRQVVKALVSGENAQTQMLTVDQVFAEEIKKQWATPNACDHKGATTPEACKQWESRGQNLPEMVNGMWPTPASCTGNGGSHGLDGGSGARSMLPEDMKRSSGKLNPRWVETLMGLPIGWTMPSCTSPQTIAPMSCGSLATELCQAPQSEHSEFSLES
jgi:hypothetical protein